MCFRNKLQGRTTMCRALQSRETEEMYSPVVLKQDKVEPTVLVVMTLEIVEVDLATLGKCQKILYQMS